MSITYPIREQAWDTSIGKVGVTGSIGGAALAAGASATGSVVIPGASALLASNSDYATTIGASMMVNPSTVGAPGEGFVVSAQLDATETDKINVYVTNATAASGTPTASSYTVLVVPF